MSAIERVTRRSFLVAAAAMPFILAAKGRQRHRRMTTVAGRVTFTGGVHRMSITHEGGATYGDPSVTYGDPLVTYNGMVLGET
jgi:hypothetical protein